MRKKLYIFKHLAKSKKLFLSFSVWFPLSLKHWSPLVYIQNLQRKTKYFSSKTELWDQTLETASCKLWIHMLLRVSSTSCIKIETPHNTTLKPFLSQIKPVHLELCIEGCTCTYIKRMPITCFTPNLWNFTIELSVSIWKIFEGKC